MVERGLNQKLLSELLGVSTSRISEYLNGKSEPTLKVTRTISTKLSIEPYETTYFMASKCLSANFSDNFIVI